MSQDVLAEMKAAAAAFVEEETPAEVVVDADHLVGEADDEQLTTDDVEIVRGAEHEDGKVEENRGASSGGPRPAHDPRSRASGTGSQPTGSDPDVLIRALAEYGRTMRKRNEEEATAKAAAEALKREAFQGLKFLAANDGFDLNQPDDRFQLSVRVTVLGLAAGADPKQMVKKLAADFPEKSNAEIKAALLGAAEREGV